MRPNPWEQSVFSLPRSKSRKAHDERDGLTAAGRGYGSGGGAQQARSEGDKTRNPIQWDPINDTATRFFLVHECSSPRIEHYPCRIRTGARISRKAGAARKTPRLSGRDPMHPAGGRSRKSSPVGKAFYRHFVGPGPPPGESFRAANLSLDLRPGRRLR
jgi:hypothetical protein